jgi:hypothetical protein
VILITDYYLSIRYYYPERICGIRYFVGFDLRGMEGYVTGNVLMFIGSAMSVHNGSILRADSKTLRQIETVRTCKSRFRTQTEEGGNKMKKFLLGTILLAMAVAAPVQAIAGVDIGVSIGIPLPPPIVFETPPAVIALPDTNSVYTAPDVDADIYFWNGWWWRPWEGRWYRSHYYNRSWAYYNNVPAFYYDVDPGWRRNYREHNWYGHPWNYERIQNRRLQQNWKSWHNERHWERQGTWGVQNYQPRPNHQRQELRYQRQAQYQQRPEVQRHQQRMQELERQQRQGQLRVQQPQRQERQQAQQFERHQRPQQEYSQVRGQRHSEESQRKDTEGRPEGADEARRR